LPKPILANISDGLKILIKIRATVQTLSLVQQDTPIKQIPLIKIETSKNESFKYYKKIISHIQIFLSLETVESMHLLTIEELIEVNQKKDKAPYSLIKAFYRLSDIHKGHKTLNTRICFLSLKIFSVDLTFF